MRFLGIDYGTKKVGLSVSDEGAKLAFPLAVLPNDKNLLKKIAEVCKKNNIEKIVLGLPEGYKGGASNILKQIEHFKLVLKSEIKLPVIYENEVLTTVQAGRVQGLHSKIDSSSAALILQTYLERRRN